MVGEDVRAGSEFDAFGLGQRLRDDQVGRGIGLPWRGEVLADPGFQVAELIGAAQHFEVPFMPRPQIAFGRMAGHQKKSKLHAQVLPWPYPATINILLMYRT